MEIAKSAAVLGHKLEAIAGIRRRVMISPNHTDIVVTPPSLPDGTTNQNPNGLSFLALLREDLQVHDNNIWEQGFWAIAAHRFGNWRMGIRPKIFRAPFSLLYIILNKWVEWTCGISLPYTVKLGRRVRIWHFGGIFINAISIGNDVHIRQNTTIGIARMTEAAFRPIVEDRVDIGCGACILGRVRVGHDSAIGANAVVLRDVPPHSLAVGVPALIKLRSKTQFDKLPES